MILKTTNMRQKIEVMAAVANAPVALAPEASQAGAEPSMEKVAAHPQEKLSKYHGEIARGVDGNVDVAAEMGKRPDALWIRVKAIEADRENDNGDYFSREEIVKSYKTFEGCPVFTNHENSKVENAKGKVVKADWDDSEGAVYCTMFVDRKVAPGLCRAIEEGYITDVSMGTQVDYSTCSICGNRALTADTYCYASGTPVIMADFSLKNIEDIAEGELVLDADGLPTRVTQCFVHDVNEDVQCLTSRVIDGELLCTGNHPLMVIRRGEYCYVNASDIADDEKLFSPIPVIEESLDVLAGLPLNGEGDRNLASRMLGYYAAEGCRIKDRKGEIIGVGFSLNATDDEHVIKDIFKFCSLFGYDPSICDRRKYGAHCKEVRIYNKDVSSFLLANITGKARTKKFSHGVVRLPLELLKQVIGAYVDGDGHSGLNGKIVIHSASRDLISQTYCMLLRIGSSATINSYMQPGGPTGRDKRFKVYRLSISNSQLGPLVNCGVKLAKSGATIKVAPKLKYVLTEDGKYVKSSLFSISKVPYVGPVYNIETESHSYVANNVVSHNCDHIKTMKGRSLNGGKVYEKNYGLKFIEISVVTDGACKDCTIREIMDPGDLAKVAQEVRDHIKTGVLSKEAGQEEIQKLNQSMDLIEDVARAMLDQRQYIDMEFLKDLTDVLSGLQHVTDELVDQGYASVGAQPAAPGIPPPPGSEPSPAPEAPTMQEQEQGAQNATMTGPTETGVGKVTGPAMASGDRPLLVARIKDLHERARKFLEESTPSRGGIDQVNTDKLQETVKKLAGIWENPSVKDFKTEISEGDFKIVVGRDEVIGLLGADKVASLKVAELDADIKASLESKPRETAGHMLDALKAKFAGLGKRAEKAPTDTKGQQEQTMEAQLAEQRPPLHPREGDVRESITEKQLQENWREYDYHDRKDEPRDSITEKQLADGGNRMPEHFARQDKARDQVMEGQLRDKDIKGNVTPADKGGAWVAGVDDQHEQITEGQLEDWKKSDKGHHPEMITEKQLQDQKEPWGRRIASKKDARLALAAGFRAIARTAIATRATPDEIVEAIRDFSASPENTLKAAGFANKSASGKAAREKLARRASFHGNVKVASADDVQNFLLGSLSDVGMSGEVGVKVLDTLATQGGATEKIAEAIKAGLDDQPKPAPAQDFLRDAIAETADEVVKVIIPASDIKGDGDEAFAKAAFEAASKLASAQGLDPKKLVHVARKDKFVEVAITATKAAPKEEKTAEAPKKEEKIAAEVEARKEARQKIVEAQMPGGGMPAGPDPMAAPGGTTMPTPAPAGDPMAPGAPPPVSALGQDAPPPGEEDVTEGESLPPGSICPACGSDDVDIKSGDFNCNQCGASGSITVSIDIKNWPGSIEEKTPEAAGDEAAGGIEMPEIGLAQSFRITQDMVKKAGGKPIGHRCPHCASSKVKLAMSEGSGKGKCDKCGNGYKVDTYVNTATKDLWGRIEWIDQNVAKLAASRCQAMRKTAGRKAELDKALAAKGLSAKFAKASISGKAEIIAKLHNDGVIGG